MRTTYLAILLCLVVGVTLARRPSGGGRPGSGRQGGGDRPGKGGRPGPKEVTEQQSEKLFFCLIAQRACHLVEDGEDPLVDRTCPGNATCDGSSGTVSLNGTDYTITFCAKPDKENRRKNERLNRERVEPTEALKEICTRLAFAGRGKAGGWYEDACLVTDGDDTVKERECPYDLECITRLTDMDYKDKKVDAGYCGGFHLRHTRGRKGKRGKGNQGKGGLRRQNNKAKRAKGRKRKAGKGGIRRKNRKGKGSNGRKGKSG